MGVHVKGGSDEFILYSTVQLLFVFSSISVGTGLVMMGAIVLHKLLGVQKGVLCGL